MERRRLQVLLPVLLLWASAAIAAPLSSEAIAAPSSSEAIATPLNLPQDRVATVANSRQWLRLLHYQPNLLGRLRSELDGKGYFFAANGKWDARAELEATAANMNNGELKLGFFKVHPQCAFPERYRFLKEKFGNLWTDVSCPDLERYMGQFHDPEAVSLVFSTAYPNNPASMFGHTFFRFHSKRRTDLLDSGVNFAAAVADDENPMAFVVFGLGGGYIGQWSILPYYVKINEYVKNESRDLWEYELALSSEETRRLLLHLWELQTNSYFDYYFFDENCSYQVLAALEAIRTDWNLLDFKLGLVPGESVKNVVYQDGAVRDIRFRPSLYHQLFNHYDHLSRGERRLFHQVIDKKIDLNLVTSRPVLDASIVYLDYLSHERPQKFATEYESFRKSVLSHRATLGLATAEERARVPKLKGETRPELGHDPYRIHFGQLYRDDPQLRGESITTLTLKFPYHDLLDPDAGYTRYAHIEFPSIEFNYGARTQRLRVERVNLLSTTSIMPYSPLDKRFAFKFSSGMYTARDYGCDDCGGHWFAEGGIGQATDFGIPSHRLYALIVFRPELSSNLERGYRIRPGAEVGWLLNPTDFYKLRMKAANYWRIGAAESVSGAARQTDLQWDNVFYFSRNWQLRQNFNWQLSSDRAQPTTAVGLEAVLAFR